MSKCRVLGKLWNHVIEVVFFSMEEDTYMYGTAFYQVISRLTGHVRKVKALTRSRARDLSVYKITCLGLTWVSYVVDTTSRDNLLE